MTESDATRLSLRHKLHTVIFEADAPGGKAFDVALLLAIVASIVAVFLESVSSIRAEYGSTLRTVEWVLTILFTIEYMLRLYAVERPLRYARSFYGVVDLLAILPTYLSLVFAGTQGLLVIRGLRLLRVFRVFKLVQFTREAEILVRALRGGGRKILVFLGGVVMLIMILGTLMYMVEGEDSGFTSIPAGVYWAIVTVTTVGYGDITPITILGKFIASLAMIAGYAIIAVPTGIVGMEMHRAFSVAERTSTQACPSCSAEGHDDDARHCNRCGTWLHPERPQPSG